MDYETALKRNGKPELVTVSYEVNWHTGEFEIWKVFSRRLGKQITISQNERERIMEELEQR
jgi:hypothetical protein